MANETITPLGPLFGPNFIIIDVNDDTNRLFQIEVFPDANNPLLKTNGLPAHYYFMPQRVYLAKKQDSPTDFDFGATIFKGLMTTEDTVGVTDAMTESGSVSEGGGFCTFSTTFAIPESVIRNAIGILKQQGFSKPSNFGNFARFFHIEQNDPTPELGIVPILENDVTIEVPQVASVGTPGAPMFVGAQGTGKGSIEATSISTFLVTLNMPAAGAIIGSLKKGVSPFTVHYNLKQQFYINACDIHMIIDVDKVFDQFSGSLSAGGFLGIDSAALSVNYQSCITSGAIKTIIKMQGSDVPDDLKKMIDQQVQDMQTRAFNLVKSEIFDWQPTADPPATTDRGFFSSIFGGSSVSLKSNHQKKGIHLTQDFQIDTTVSKLDTVSGDLNDLMPAIKANLDKYLAIVDIGEYFKKIQVAATTNVNWSEKTPDGTELSDPIQSVQVQVSYPDFDAAIGANKTVNLRTQANGFHYVIGNKDPKGPGELAVWTKDNPHDIINISFLRLDKAIPQWDSDQVKVTKTIVFDSMDPRVDITNNRTTFTKEVIDKNHAPVITPDEVGYLFVKFAMDRRLPTDNISITLTCSIGSRKDTIVVTKSNQSNIIWEIFSDKYLNETSFKLDVQVEVSGSNFTDDPVVYSTSQPILVQLPGGRLKYVNPYIITLPKAPADLVNTINGYIKASQAVGQV
jgi:hypothetical protein